MKKLSYLFAIITMCMFSQQLQAQPLYVNNNSDIGDFPYDITTYLIYSRAGEVCSGHDWALPFTFEAGSMLTINDGSFVWQNNLCISEPIGYGCEPVPIEFYGQRINNILYDVTNPEDYVFGGLFSSLVGYPCLGSSVGVSTPYGDPDWDSEISGDYTVTVSYGGSTIATINYMNWGFMQTLSFS